jgi:hypothetical protein
LEDEVIKVAFLIFTLALTRIGCEEPVSPLNTSGEIIVRFASGFERDSAIIKIDHQVHEQLYLIDDEGCSMMVNIGYHRLELGLPLLNLQAEVIFVVISDRPTELYAILDRNHNRLLLENHTPSDFFPNK